MKTKVCTKCKQELPATTEYFHLHKMNRLQPRCKVCKIEDQKASYRKFREKNIENARLYREKNKDTLIKYRKDKYSANKEKILEYQKTWRNKNKNKVYLWNRKKYLNNKIKYREKNKEWRKNNPLRCLAMRQKRRARLANTLGEFTKQDVENIFYLQNGRCNYCNVKLKKNYHLDHIIPLVLGGSNWPSNLCIACAECNLSKGSKPPMVWLAQRFGEEYLEDWLEMKGCVYES